MVELRSCENLLFSVQNRRLKAPKFAEKHQLCLHFSRPRRVILQTYLYASRAKCMVLHLMLVSWLSDKYSSRTERVISVSFATFIDLLRCIGEVWAHNYHDNRESPLSIFYSLVCFG
jgi:hypothetical protein